MATSRRREHHLMDGHQLNMMSPFTLLRPPSTAGGYHPAPTTFNFGIGVFPLIATAVDIPPETSNFNGENEEPCLFIRCTDCGNRAKKDCVYRRCRACCKNNGFGCSTHVKSTWVPASRRPDRRQLPVAPDASSGSSSRTDADFKRALPRKVQAQATFRCTRVTAVDDGEHEVSYQAVVNIGGHVFKGFLFDQGN